MAKRSPRGTYGCLNFINMLYLFHCRKRVSADVSFGSCGKAFSLLSNRFDAIVTILRPIEIRRAACLACLACSSLKNKAQQANDWSLVY